MDFFRVILNDDEWTIYLVSEEDMTSLYDEDGETPRAFTEFDKKEMHFVDTDLGTIRHELTHAAFSYIYLDDASLTYEQLEEVMCDFMCKRFDWFIEKSNYIYEQLKALKDNSD